MNREEQELVRLAWVHYFGRCQDEEASGIIDIDRLIYLAQLNKTVHTLGHILVCGRCSSNHSAISVIKIQRLLNLHKKRQKHVADERVRLCGCINDLGVHGVEFKSFPAGNPREKQGFESDVDILVDHQESRRLVDRYSSMGYRIRKYPPKEIMVTNPKTGIGVDIHTRIAHPHFGSLREENMLRVRRFSQDLLDEVRERKPGLHKPKPVLRPVSMVIGFWQNDLGFGLSGLSELLYWVQNNPEGSVQKAMEKARGYGFAGHMSFFITGGMEFFDRYGRAIRDCKNTAGLASWCLARIFARQFVISRRPAIGWHDSDNKWAHDLGMLHHRIDRVIDEDGPRREKLRAMAGILGAYLKIRP